MCVECGVEGMITVEALARDDTRLDQLPPLFRAYYDSMSETGLRMPLVENGEFIWLEGIRKSVGRLYQLIVAQEEGEVRGFVFGYIRITPQYLGAQRVGFVDGLYLAEQYRRGPLVIRMIKELYKWFNAQQVASLELQVLLDNEHTWKFWEGMGFRRELYLLRNEHPFQSGSR